MKKIPLKKSSKNSTSSKKKLSQPKLKFLFVVAAVLLTAGVFASKKLFDLHSSQVMGDTSTVGTPKPRVYVYEYIWWSQSHWQDKLGSAYVTSTQMKSPLPLPATVADDGCTGLTNLYTGNQIIDVPEDVATAVQDNPGVLENDVRTAAKAGVAGFIVNWNGTGSPTQTVTSTVNNHNNQRLQALVDATHKVNAEGIPFSLWISYKASASILTTSYIDGDFTYLKNNYLNDTAFDHYYSPRMMVIWQGSLKYPIDQIQTISTKYRPYFFLLGDEKSTTWDIDARPQYLDGSMSYWSTQSPYTNPGSFDQIKTLAAKVRSSGSNPDGSKKLWFAPMTAGYNSILLGGTTCIPRQDSMGSYTMQKIFDGNSASNPDGWTFISWNEVAEGSFIMPMQRWGTRYLDVLSSIINGSGSASPVPTPSPIASPVMSPSPSPVPTPSPVASPVPSPSPVASPVPSPTPLSDMQAPNVIITSPVSYQTVPKGTFVSINVAATDNVKVTKLEVRVNGSSICSTTTSAFSCRWKVGKSAGVTYTIEAKAYDAAGNVGKTTNVVTSK